MRVCCVSGQSVLAQRFETADRVRRAGFPRGGGRAARALLAGFALFCLLWPLAIAPASAETTLDVSREDGFGRIVITFDELPDYQVRASTGVITVTFDGEVAPNAQLISDALPGYLTAGRTDPDRRGIRLALAQTVTVNTMEAGRKLFLDLLPSGWSGPPPPLPPEVIEELRQLAELEMEQQRERERQDAIRAAPEIGLDLLLQPTFARLVFAWEGPVDAAISRADETVTVTFPRWGVVPVARVRPRFPDYLMDMTVEQGETGTIVTLTVDPTSDVRGFVEDRSYIVDIVDRNALDRVVPSEGDQAFLPDLPGPPPIAGGGLSSIGARPDADSVPDDAAEAPPPPGGAVAVTEQALPLDGPAPPRPADAPAEMAAPSPRDTEAATAVDPALPREEVAEDIAAEVPDDAPPLARDAEAADDAGDDDVRDGETAEASIATIPAVTPSEPVDMVRAEARRFGSSVRLEFPFKQKTPAAIFQYHGELWMVFATAADLDIRSLRSDLAGIVGDITVESFGDASLVRMRLLRRYLTNTAIDGNAWLITIGDLVLDPARPLTIERGVTPEEGPLLRVPMQGIAGRYAIVDTVTGGDLIAVVAYGPAQSLFKNHNLVELDFLKTAHGLVIRPKADGISVFVEPDMVEIVRAPGLSLSADSWRPSVQAGEEAGQVSRAGFVALRDDEMPQGAEDFLRRRNFLVNRIATVDGVERTQVRVELAKTLLSQDFAAEALGLINLAAEEDTLTEADPVFHAMRGVAQTILGRHDDALQDLEHRLLIDSPDAALWRGLILSETSRPSEALAQFALGEPVIASYPSRRQRQFRLGEAAAALEVNDLETAFDALTRAQDLATNDGEFELLLLRGRLAEQLDNPEDALVAYNRVIRHGDRQAEVEARLRRARLLIDRNGIDPVDAVKELESLSVSWRGDEIELESLRTLAQLYSRDKDYRRAFEIMEAATLADSASPITRSIQDDMSEVFTSLYIGDRQDDLGPIDALALFYDFRELTPIGREGDELIRALSDRLIEVDLLDQSAHLLRHQVDERLRGAARAQVAARLAMVLLMDRKPEQALSVLARTRQAVLPEDVMLQRLLLEAQALAETGRHRLAVELLETVSDPDAERLRAEVLWDDDDWQAAGEAFERLAGDLWQAPEAVTDTERADVLRAAIAYALAGDSLGLDRLRTRYVDIMAQSPDAQAFDTVTYEPVVGEADFRAVVQAIAGIDSVERFLDYYRARFDTAPMPQAET